MFHKNRIVEQFLNLKEMALYRDQGKHLRALAGMAGRHGIGMMQIRAG